MHLTQDNSLGFALTTTLNVLRKKFNSEIKKFDLSSEQFAVLKLIEKEALTPTELSNILKRDKANITRIVNSLEKKEFIQKKKINEKSFEVVITKKGLSNLQKAEKIAVDLNKKIRTILDDKEFECLIKTLNKIKNNF
ncbi:MarR family transcriptional regulator [Caminibacter mediatlanticus TB-2]|uniref:Transcriptional regulator n=1 Tax=Caminibacter mediatlanticus TB-2 TaxID=391592 RepID=A0AAI9AHI7_9BACT|nr:MarR family transcriptional regulator [Caminibacter mediatlanticus]EDM23625.1 putative transcriptional regulator [Caminibacter mediatlanticus TB-2]QCT93842.1 MarR family transcriptional regulator [Caminibacter mediatlanticus TB-2]